MYQRILMPTDGSSCSKQAIEQGLKLASRLGSEVTFLYVLEDPSISVYPAEFGAYQPQIYEALQNSAKEALADAKAWATAAGVSSQEILVENQNPVQAIHEAEQEVDLVVMGTHGRRGVNRWMFGSVAEGALRRSTTPYLMIHSQDDSEETPSFDDET